MARSFHQYSPKAQVLVCAALSLGAFGAARTTVIESERTELAARRTHLAVVLAGVQRATAAAQRLPSVRNEIAILEAALAQATPVVSNEKDAQSLLRDLHSLARESGVIISGFTPQPGAEREQYFEWPIELAFEGGYHDVARFFDQLAFGPRLTSVSSLQFKARTTARGPGHESVQAASVATTFLFPPPPSPITGQPRGVDEPPKSAYDDEGRRDPFTSLLSQKAPASAAAFIQGRASGLAGVAVMDVAVRGIINIGQTGRAIVAGPDGATYLVRANDRLHDGVVQRIDREAVVFLARASNGGGGIVVREVRKALRPSAGEGR